MPTPSSWGTPRRSGRRWSPTPTTAAFGRAIVIALITIPMYVNARRFGDVAAPGWSLGRWGNPVMLALALLAAVLMAVGSLLQL